MPHLASLQQAVIDGDAPAAQDLTRQALAAGAGASDLLQQALIPAMAIVGEKMKNEEYYVPEVLVAARAMQSSLAILKPLLTAAGVPPAATIVFATVRGDMHDIGKNLVIMMMEGAGFHIVDLGTDVPPARIVDVVRQSRPQLLGMSALLTTTMPAMKTTIDSLVEAGLRESVKVMIGGAPVTARYAQSIGADGCAPDAASAVDLARKLVGPLP